MSSLLSKKQDEALILLLRNGPTPAKKFDAKTIKALLQKDLIGLLQNKLCSDPRTWLVVLTRAGRHRIETRRR